MGLILENARRVQHDAHATSLHIFCEIPAIARSRSEKRSVLPPKRWKRMTSFQRPSNLRIACSIPAAADAGVCANSRVRPSLSRALLRRRRVQLCTCMPKQTNTQIDLPPPVAAYFAADSSDANAVTRCFSESAVVIDERREHRGRSAITRWKAEATAKYHYTSEPLAVDASGPEVTVTARVTGDFPGSPVELRYRFTLEGASIARLEITA